MSSSGPTAPTTPGPGTRRPRPDSRRPPRPAQAPTEDRATAPAIALAAFLLEICLLAILAVSGWRLGSATMARVAFAVLLPAVAAVVWSVWMAPQSRRRLGDPARMVAQIVLFAATAVLASLAGITVWGIAFAVVATIIFALTRVPARESGRKS